MTTLILSLPNIQRQHIKYSRITKIRDTHHSRIISSSRLACEIALVLLAKKKRRARVPREEGGLELLVDDLIITSYVATSIQSRQKLKRDHLESLGLTFLYMDSKSEVYLLSSNSWNIKVIQCSKI